ncbi:alpha/beta hydrolase [uncultured Sneathiella sp.]|jgi:pimeloyl-ACP methyl ester carboxylesterase|uniref:alpha/beta fold hydrolase n=2 Tax=uncultured Sneathiella sp. TaxID=879315 RepID=UPI0030DD7E44|tara:strand:+ start:28237 stop:29097 length:861 start_codon:yes stop_codon:yes gene_type:complete
MSFAEKYYQSQDNLNLYYREYGSEEDACPLLCLSGLTRNSADFHSFSERYSKNRKVYALDYRGRGKSDRDADYKNYNPQVYLGDIYSFLTSVGIERALFVGTSLGGLMTMAMAGFAKNFIAGAILNDVGPEVDKSGSARILDYVGKDVRFSSLEEAAAKQKEQYIGAYPDLSDEDWLGQANTTFSYDQTAKNYCLNYDLNLSKALAEQLNSNEPVDLWPFFKALGDIPTLAIRGALSDVLSDTVFMRMKSENPNMETVVLKNRGHVPLLNEPELLPVLDKFIDRIR